MLNGADIIAVLIIAGPVRFHTVDLHLQVRFPLGIDKLRIVDVRIVRQISRGSKAPQPSGSNIGKGRKQGRDQEKYQKEQDHDPAYDRVAPDSTDHSGSNLFRGNGGVLCPLSCLFRLSGCFGILSFYLLFLPHPGKKVFLQLRAVMQGLTVGKPGIGPG